MFYFGMIGLGLVSGGFIVFLLFTVKRALLEEQRNKQEAQEEKIRNTLKAIKAKQQEFGRLETELAAKQKDIDARVVSYQQLHDENLIIKRDLQNVDVSLRKLGLDHQVQQQRQETIDKRAQELGRRYLKENIKWIGSSLTANNFVASKKRLLDVIERCRSIDFDVSEKEEAALLADLKEEFEKMVRAAFEREEQARIKAQIREEQRLEKEIERELAKLEGERAAIQATLDKAMAEDEYSAEVERLKARLAEAEEKSRRAISRAQMTKSGHIYVISNIGSFGDGVFKIGMTRRLEPKDRVRELGDASVPFPFDVHMMIASDDAPTLETALHREFHRLRVNRANPRKEFFKTDIEAIRQAVEAHHGEVQYEVDPEALEYHQSSDMSEEDQEFIEKVFNAVEEESETVLEEE